MKKRIVVIGSLLLVAVIIIACSFCSKVEVAEGQIIAVFQYGDADINEPLSEEDSEIVRQIFNGKSMFSKTPSCGFSEDVALVIAGDTYCIACDTCGIIYDVEEDKYFNMNDKENETLRNLLGEYGFKFPCV